MGCSDGRRYDVFRPSPRNRSKCGIIRYTITIHLPVYRRIIYIVSDDLFPCSCNHLGHNLSNPTSTLIPTSNLSLRTSRNRRGIQGGLDRDAADKPSTSSSGTHSCI